MRPRPSISATCTAIRTAICTVCCYLFFPGLFPLAAQAANETDRMFALDRVLDIRITLSARDWDELRFQHPNLKPRPDGSFPPRTYTYFPAEVAIDGTQIAQVGVRKKGFIGSVNSQRPSLKIDFGEYVAGTRFSGMDRLTLNNNLQDPAGLNQFLTYYLFRQAKLPAPRCNFARVTVNDQDLGLYTHVESIKKPFLKRHFGDDGGTLYEGRRSDFRPHWLATFDQKTNRGQTDRADLQRLTEALASEGQGFLEQVDALVDLDHFFRFWAMECLVGHWDGYAENLNNYYLYRVPASGKFTFLPWGADEAFGRPNPFGHPGAPLEVRANGLLCRRLYNYEPTRKRYRETLTTLLEEVWDEESLVALMDRANALIAPHRQTPEKLSATWLRRVRHFIQSRRAALLSELQKPGSPWTYPLDARPGFQLGEPSGFVKATFTAPWRTQPNIFNPFAGSTLELDFEIDGERPQYLLQGAAAQPFPQAIRFGQPNIVIGGVQQANGKLLAISLTVDPELFAAGELPLDMFAVMAAVIELNPLRQEDVRVRGMLRGTLKLKQASTTPGQTIQGTLDATIYPN